MKRIVACLILCAVFLGCRSPSATIEITCKPEFEYRPRPDLVVTTQDGDRADASAQFLIIPHEGQNYRIPWGTPPVSRGPVTLSRHEIYTFTLDQTGETVLSVRQGDKLIYEAP
jgi:hypothetical protein